MATKSALVAVVLACFLVHLGSGLVDLPQRFHHGALYNLLRQEDEDPEYSNTTVAWFAQAVDHSDPQSNTFPQRYWMDLSAYDNGNEALLYIPGEGPGKSSPQGFVAVYGHERRMALFALENRYYGESLPTPLENRVALKQFFSVDDALDDLRTFQLYVEATILRRKVKWLVVGGSYAGALAVWFKVKYPNAALAVWSSSGVVEAELDFYRYDEHVAAQLSPDCAHSVRVVQEKVEQLWGNETARFSFYDRYGIPHDVDKGGVAYMLADAVAGAVQYGKKTEMCQHIVPLNGTDPLGQFLNMIKVMYGEGFTSDCGYSTSCMADKCRSDEWGSAYAWVFQCCRELGYFQVSYPGSLRMQAVNLDFFIGQCKRLFGAEVFPDVFKFNLQWGGKHPPTTNVIALQGSDDPFKEAGVTANVSALYVVHIAQCEGCGHCSDLRAPKATDPAPVVMHQTAIRFFLDIWMGSGSNVYYVTVNGLFAKLQDSIPRIIDAVTVDLQRSFEPSATVTDCNHTASTLTCAFGVYENEMNKPILQERVLAFAGSDAWIPETVRVFFDVGGLGNLSATISTASPGDGTAHEAVCGKTCAGLLIAGAVVASILAVLILAKRRHDYQLVQVYDSAVGEEREQS